MRGNEVTIGVTSPPLTVKSLNLTHILNLLIIPSNGIHRNRNDFLSGNDKHCKQHADRYHLYAIPG